MSHGNPLLAVQRIVENRNYSAEDLADLLLQEAGILLDGNLVLLPKPGSGFDRWRVIDFSNNTLLAESFDSKDDAESALKKSLRENGESDCFSDEVRKKAVILTIEAYTNNKTKHKNVRDPNQVIGIHDRSSVSAEFINNSEEFIQKLRADYVRAITNILNFGEESNSDSPDPKYEGLIPERGEWIPDIEQALELLKLKTENHLEDTVAWLRSEVKRPSGNDGEWILRESGKESRGKYRVEPPKVRGLPVVRQTVNVTIVNKLYEILDRMEQKRSHLSVMRTLAYSQMWRSEELDHDLKRPALDRDDTLASKVGDDMDGILKHMIRHQFSIQVVLDQDNKPFGLELIKLNAHRAKGNKMPETVDLSELRRLKLLTPLIQLDQHHSVDTASLYFEHGEDAIIFHHSKSIAHDDVTECLEEGLHILTAEDVTAAHLWLARS